ncbi:MAG TPA: carboxypeptidase-like regulatory domain-containing protein [Bryobacteraceae bacterium]
MRFRSLLVLFICLAIIPFGGRSFAQVLYGSVVGEVTDPSGATVPNVTVTITDKATGQSRTATSDSSG